MLAYILNLRIHIAYASTRKKQVKLLNKKFSFTLLKFYTTFSGLKPPNKNYRSLVVFIPDKVGGKNNTKNSELKLRIF
jgi:hypothetical protein